MQIEETRTRKMFDLLSIFNIFSTTPNNKLFKYLCVVFFKASHVC